MSEDLRVIKTQSAIKTAFLKLLRDKPLEDITVKEIAGLAQCNRNTFYLHYTDKYDLMESLSASCLKEMERSLYETYAEGYPSGMNWYLDIADRCLNVIEADKTFYEIALGKNRCPAFSDRLRQLMANFIDAGLNQTGACSKYKRLEIEFSANGLVGVIRYWLVNQDLYSKAEIAKEMENFVIKVGTVIFEDRSR